MKCKKQITRILLLGILLLMPLAEADANYYYKVRLVDANGTSVKFDIKNEKSAVINSDSEWSPVFVTFLVAETNTSDYQYFMSLKFGFLGVPV